MVGLAMPKVVPTFKECTSADQARKEFSATRMLKVIIVGTENGCSVYLKDDEDAVLLPESWRNVQGSPHPSVDLTISAEQAHEILEQTGLVYA